MTRKTHTVLVTQSSLRKLGSSRLRGDRMPSSPLLASVSSQVALVILRKGLSNSNRCRL
jgi:hypothetical protein